MPSFDGNSRTFLLALAVFGILLAFLAILFRFLPEARRRGLALAIGFLGGLLAASALVLLSRMADDLPVGDGSDAREMLERFRQATPTERIALLARLPDSGRAWHRVERGEVGFTIVGRGVLESAHITPVDCQLRARKPGSPVAGVIKWVIEDGKMVKKGDLILEIDDRELKKELQTLESKRIKTDGDIARIRGLKADIADCRICAPRDGAVKHFVSPGGWGERQPRLAEGETVSERQRLFDIHDVSKWRVSVSLHEKQAGSVRVGQKALIRISSLAPRTLRGEVRSEGTVPRPSDAFALDARVYDPKIAILADEKEIDGLRPDMDAEVIIEDRRPNVVRLPMTALLRLGPMDYCFIKSGEGIVYHQVEIGLRDDFFAEIKGLQEGEEVLRDPRGVALQLAGLAAPAEGTPSLNSTGDGEKKN